MTLNIEPSLACPTAPQHPMHIARISPSPSALRRAADPVGAETDGWLRHRLAAQPQGPLDEELLEGFQQGQGRRLPDRCDIAHWGRSGLAPKVRNRLAWVNTSAVGP